MPFRLSVPASSKWQPVTGPLGRGTTRTTSQDASPDVGGPAVVGLGDRIWSEPFQGRRLAPPGMVVREPLGQQIAGPTRMRDLDTLLNSLVSVDRKSLIAILMSEAEKAEH